MTRTRPARGALAAVLVVSLSMQTSANAQEAPQPPNAGAPAFRTTLKLVQVDAVVTDGKGRHVTDLTAGDFELKEDGKRQEISNCAFVPTEIPKATPGPSETAAAPAAQPQAGEVQRTVALVVDDLALDMQSIVTVRNGLATFVEKQIQPGDLVSVVRTGSGTGALQQFTTDKRILRAAVDRVRFNQTAEVDAFEPLNSTPVLRNPHDAGIGTVEFARVHDAVITGGTIGALKFVLTGLRDLPGRKSVVFFSKGYALRESDGTLTAFGRAVPGLVDLANRASVVIYTVDALGVPTGQLTAADNTNDPNEAGNTQARFAPGGAGAVGASADAVLKMILARGARSLNDIDGLEALSDATGGLLLRGNNDPSEQLGRVLEDQKGYYLIGYVPGASTFESRNGRPTLHRLKLTVRRKGLVVRARSLFYGITDDDPRQNPTGEPTTLASVLMSPFRAGAVGVRLHALFFHDKVRGDLLHSFLHVDAGALTLDQGADGLFRSRVEIQALTFDADSQLADQLHRFGEVTFSPERRDKALRRGIGYVIDIPVKKPGAYQVRVAFRDTASGRLGSAYEFVTVPDLGGQGLSLSGILMTDASPPESRETTDGLEVEPDAPEALRVLPPGRPVAYGLTIYNAQAEPETSHVELSTRLRLLRDGREVVSGQPKPVDVAGQTDVKALFAGGTLLLPPQIEEGDYVLQVTVTDGASPANRRVAVQAAEITVKR
jgi:VWFA-related protein